MCVDLRSCSLEGQVAIVTGGARGIGQSLVEALLTAGTRVAIVSRTMPRPSNLKSRELDSRTVKWFRTDLSTLDNRGASDLVERVEGTFGPVSILVNNAGEIRFGSATEIPLVEWDYLLRLNVTAPLLLSQAVAASMCKQRYGRIVNITSVLGFIGKPGVAAYVATKHALEGLTKALAAEWGPMGVTVNSIAPGDIHSDPGHPPPRASQRVSVGRCGLPSDLASCLLWIASPSASFVNGQAIVIDGGLLSQ